MAENNNFDVDVQEVALINIEKIIKMNECYINLRNAQVEFDKVKQEYNKIREDLLSKISKYTKKEEIFKEEKNLLKLNCIHNDTVFETVKGKKLEYCYTCGQYLKKN